MLVAALMMAAAAQFQRRGGGRFGYGHDRARTRAYDGAFTFCRIMFRNALERRRRRLVRRLPARRREPLLPLLGAHRPRRSAATSPATSITS